MKTRIGAVSYLNTKPLIEGFDSRVSEGQLHLDLPSRLADALAQSQLDLALIPSVEFLRSAAVESSYSIVSNACIACRGPVRSVQLLFRCPPKDVKSLSLDEGSRTSAALAQVLLWQGYGIRPEVRPLSIDADFYADSADASVVIGDRAMNIDANEFTECWDLGEHWNRQTGLPFVFAMWVSSAEAKHRIASSQLGAQLESCRDAGLKNLEQIVAREAPKYNLAPYDCHKYFSEQLHFHLGERELAGLDLFRQQATELGLVPHTCTQLSLQPI